MNLFSFLISFKIINYINIYGVNSDPYIFISETVFK